MFSAFEAIELAEILLYEISQEVGFRAGEAKDNKKQRP